MKVLTQFIISIHSAVFIVSSVYVHSVRGSVRDAKEEMLSLHFQGTYCRVKRIRQGTQGTLMQEKKILISSFWRGLTDNRILEFSQGAS